MTTSFADLIRAGVLGRYDEHFAKALARLVPGSPEPVIIAAALASRAVREGHVCADLEHLVRHPPRAAEEEGGEAAPLVLPPLAEWLELLRASPLVGVEERDRDARPLVLASGKRLYLHRYRAYERELAGNLLERAAADVEVDEVVLRESLGRLFGGEGGDDGKQRTAAAVAALRRLAVISGGPGTGKTHTAARLIATLVEQARAANGKELRVLLLAPTGKAAARLGESMQRNVAALPCDDQVRRLIPLEASTIHRALGPVPSSETRFRRDAENPLPVDAVVVDEASMVDVALMAKLVAAVPRSSRLVLMGDKDQLASVEAGAILSDIYGDAARAGDVGDGGFSPAFAARLERVTGVRVPVVRGEPPHAALQAPKILDCRVHLTESRRYGGDSGIGRVARAVNAGDADAALEALRSGTDVSVLPTAAGDGLEAALAERVVEAFRDLARGTPAERLAILDRFRVLTAHRRGKFGAPAVNRVVERILRDRGVLRDESEWYDGRPILVTENDHQLELYNGDVGIICKQQSGQPEAWFRTAAGVRKIFPGRLPPHETVFAMTVHKSQGSEFDDVVLVLPDRPSPVLTRELVYTAVTRARAHLEIIGPLEVLRAAVAIRVERASGLGDALWSADPPTR